MRKNERNFGEEFTATRCDICKEWYEPDRKHICRKENSYPIDKLDMRPPKLSAVDSFGVMNFNCERTFRGKMVNKCRDFERDGYWCYGDLITNRKSKYIHPKANCFQTDGEISKLLITHEVVPESVGQYTGAADINGKDVYEKDIVKYGDDICEVVFEQRNKTAYFGIRISATETIPLGHYTDKVIEVIGNSYDNPELLEVQYE